MSDVITELANEANDKAAEIARLKAENDRLREERDMYRDLVDCMVHPDIPDQLTAENAELRERIDATHMSRLLTENENESLRELVSGLEYCAQGHVCDCCPLYDPSGTNRRRCESLERELGIEVDE